MAELRFLDLDVDNLFDACSMLDAIGAEEVLKAFNTNEINSLFDSGEDTSGIGLILAMKVCGIVVRYIPKARDEICTFFAGCLEWDNGTKVTIDEVRKMKINQFMDLIREFFKRDDVLDFFRQVVGLVGLDGSNSRTPSITDTATEPENSSAAQSGGTG